MVSKININIFLKNYLRSLNNALEKISKKELVKASKLIEKTIKSDKHIYICGNGGSGAIADHYVVDYTKQLSKHTSLKAKIRSLNADNYLISAIANDISFDEIFSYQAARYIKTGDIMILISSSGNSKNIKNVLKYCNKNNIKTIGFSNFLGGYLKNNCTISIHSKIENYGIGEDINHILMHSIMQYLSLNNISKSKNKNKKIIL